MPRTRTTWTTSRGRPRGAKDKTPRTAKRVVEWLLERYALDVGLFDKAMRAGLRAKPGTSAAYCRMVLDHHAGAPDQAVTLTGRVVLVSDGKP